MKKTPDLSIVLPIYNEEESVVPLCRKIREALDPFGRPYEIVLVDDGSSDGSWRAMRETAEKHPNMHLVRFRRNFGQTAALAAGFDAAAGRIVVTMDSDLQNDPADIPAVVEKLESEGADVVSGWRKDRKDSFIRTFPSRIMNGFIAWYLELPIHDNGCSLKAYRSEVVKGFHLYGEMHRFVVAHAKWVGGKIVEMPVRHHPRQYGTSKYAALFGLARIPRVVLDTFTMKFLLKYSNRPMHLFGKIGGWCLLAGALMLGLVGFEWLASICGGGPWFGGSLLVKRPFWVIAPFMFLGFAAQFFVMGLNAELNTRTWFESQKKPVYTVRETFDSPETEG
ncbi:MAG: glycosyltransferase family 2 protein [Kiritimatiellae bacterium]|nr:glycosyltransferase family 2 protein [Kiritimatiellia bacterium]